MPLFPGSLRRNAGRAYTTTQQADLDGELAARTLAGDREALARLLDRHLGAVYGSLRRRLGRGHEELAAELTAETFEIALARLGRYARGRADAPMRLWLIRLASQRLARRRKELAKLQDGVPTDGGADEGTDHLRAALLLLPPRKQAALSLALLERMSPAEIAATLGTSVPKAMRLLRAALKQAGKAMPEEP